MRIAKIEAIPVSYPEPNDFNALRHLCLCKITADDGQVGWGESITQFPEANFAAKAIIEGMAPNLIGKDPVHTEALWNHRFPSWLFCRGHTEETVMNSIIYLVGLVVVVGAILAFLGLR